MGARIIETVDPLIFLFSTLPLSHALSFLLITKRNFVFYLKPQNDA